MDKGKELAKNTIIIGIGKVSTQLISFFLLPLYTAVLLPKEFGIVDLSITWVTLLVPIFTLQIEQAILRYMIDFRGDNISIKEIITVSTCFNVFECILYSLLFFIAQFFIPFEYKWFIIANIIASAFSIMLIQISRGFGKTLIYSVGSFILATSTIILNIIFLVILKMGAEGMLLANFLGNICCFLFLFLKLQLWKYIDIKSLKMSRFNEMLKYSIPLVPNALSWWIINASDRVIVSGFLGVSANGIIAVAHKFPTAYTTLFYIFSLSWTESAALYLKKKDGPIFFEKTTQTLFNIFLAVFLLCVSILPMAFHILVDKQYDESYRQIPIFMLAALFNIVVGLYSVIYTTYLATKEIMKTTIFAGVVNIIISFATIHYIGIYAASIATAVSYGLMALYRYYDSRKYVTLKLDNQIIFSGLLMTIMVFFAYYLRYMPLCWAAFAIIIVYSIFINRNFMKDTLLTVKTLISNRRRR